MTALKWLAVAIAGLATAPSTPSRTEAADGPVEVKRFDDAATWRWSDSPFDSMTAVVRSSSEWVTLWKPESPRAGLHPVDFREWMIVLVAPGPGSDYRRLRITGTYLRGDTLLVTTEEFRSCLTMSQVIRPFDAVAVRRLPGVVRFLWKQRVWQEVCGKERGYQHSDNNRVAPARPSAAPEKPAQTFAPCIGKGSRRRA